MFKFNHKQTLITSAFEGEIDLLRKQSKFPHLEPMGIGNLEQAIQVSSYLLQNPDVEQIVFLGSCGVYPWSSYPMGAIVSPKEVHSKEISDLFGLGKQLPTNPPFHSLKSDPSFSETICNAPTTITLQEIDAEKKKIWEHFQVENLELFGLTKVAERFQIPVTAYLVITNVVGPNGSAQWQTNWREASNQLQESFLKHQT
ncbi:phosphorylase [Leptospira jelokensis]|uniref:phosphorylase n=1 Tax=Leptospira jelokensis TaxID=2484931 RepID=UPI0010916FD1|nr:phosphorylase [Leptospira jelokensis]TGL99741.1 phosphorylase [Leptospira jelokensis]